MCGLYSTWVFTRHVWNNSESVLFPVLETIHSVCRRAMDYSQHIPVLCQTDGSFCGKSYWEKISVMCYNGKFVNVSTKQEHYAERDKVFVLVTKTTMKWSSTMSKSRRRIPSPLCKFQQQLLGVAL